MFTEDIWNFCNINNLNNINLVMINNYFINTTKPIYLGINHQRYNFDSISFNKLTCDDILYLKEAYGKIEFGNKEYESIIKSISNKIKNDLQKGLIYDTKLDNQLLFKRYYVDNCTKWIDDLTIYVSDIFEDENDSCVIDRNQYDAYAINLDKIDFYSFPFTIKNNKIYNVSIYINCVNLNDKEFDIYYVILHELKHIYDAYIRKYVSIELNHDLITYQTLRDQIVNDPKKLIIDQICTDNFNGVTAGDVFKYIMVKLYLLNDSEIQARIENTIGQLNKINVEITLKNRKDLCRYSSLYKEYYWIYMRLNFCLKLTDEQIQIFEDRYLNMFNNIYKTKFKNYIQLIQFLIKRLDKLYFKHIINYLINQ